MPNFRFGAAIVIENCAIGRIFQSFLLCGCQKRLYGSFLLFPILPFMPRPVHLIKKIHKCAASIRFADGGAVLSFAQPGSKISYFLLLESAVSRQAAKLRPAGVGQRRQDRRETAFPKSEKQLDFLTGLRKRKDSPRPDTQQARKTFRPQAMPSVTGKLHPEPKERASPMHRRSVSMP